MGHGEDNRILRSKKYKVFGGVCSGIALSKGWSISLVRLIALFAFGTVLGIFLYLAFWIFLPSNSSPEQTTLNHDPLTRTTNDKMIAGVCGGIAKLLKWDPAIVRIAFVVLLVCYGVALLPYIYAWIVLPTSNDNTVIP